MNILIQFPTYARREKFFNCFEKYLERSSTYHRLYFNVNCDKNDTSMNNADVPNRLTELVNKYNTANHIQASLFFDANTTKISSINAHIDDYLKDDFNFDIVMCASDDMVPQIDKWDNEIAKDMCQFFPQTNGALHYNDGYQGENLITLSILGRSLYDYFGYIYHPDYKSLYCDAEFTEQVQSLGRIKYIDKLIIKHEHYGESGNSNSGDLDLSAKKTLWYSGRDQFVYEDRKKRGFPKERITND